VAEVAVVAIAQEEDNKDMSVADPQQAEKDKVIMVTYTQTLVVDTVVTQVVDNNMKQIRRIL
jgi:hypothetical protein